MLETLQVQGKRSTARAKGNAPKKPPKAAKKQKRKSRLRTSVAARARAAQQASKMEAIGRLAGGIAHDFNNLLTVILGHSEFLLKRDKSRANFRLRVEEIRKAAERGAWLDP